MPITGEDAPDDSEIRLGGRRLRAARTATLLSFGVLALAATADVDRDSARWFGQDGPRCPLGRTFGEEHCPGCGLTRSVGFATQGEFTESFLMHPAGPAIASILLVAGLLGLRVWIRGRATHPEHLARLWLQRSFVTALILGSLWRLLRSSTG